MERREKFANNLLRLQFTSCTFPSMARVAEFTSKDDQPIFIGPDTICSVRKDIEQPELTAVTDMAGTTHRVKESVQQVVNAWKD